MTIYLLNLFNKKCCASVSGLVLGSRITVVNKQFQSLTYGAPSAVEELG